jgi:hypothetical protein
MVLGSKDVEAMRWIVFFLSVGVSFVMQTSSLCEL